MSKTRSIGIRLPIELWELVKVAEPGLTYSEIVRRALEEKYNFFIISHEHISKIIDSWSIEVNKK
jgi:hypothetical protein